MVRYFLLLGILVCILSCRKDPGFGGRASVSGKVWVDDYTPGGILEASGYTGNINVQIAVDGSKSILKSIETDYNGAYEFKGLHKGVYKVWVYTECDTCTDNQTPVVQTVKIEKAKEEKLLADFKIKM